MADVGVKAVALSSFSIRATTSCFIRLFNVVFSDHANEYGNSENHRFLSDHRFTSRPP